MAAVPIRMSASLPFPRGTRGGARPTQRLATNVTICVGSPHSRRLPARERGVAVRKAWMASIGGLAVLGAVAAIAVGQAPPPTVAVTASPTAVTVGATGALPAGPTTFRVTRAASEQGLGVYF